MDIKWGKAEELQKYINRSILFDEIYLKSSRKGAGDE